MNNTRFPFGLAFAVLLFSILAPDRFSSQAQEHAEKTALGVVFHDVDGDGRFGSSDKPLADIRVSNGRRIVKTDKQGQYRLEITDDTILFVIKPRGWRTPIDENQIPRFYYIHKPAGSPASKFAGVAPTGPLPDSVNFPLYPQDEPEKFQAILFGDPQPKTQTEVDYIGHDVVEELVGRHNASFGVTLGDIVDNNLDLFEPQARAIALLGIPWYNVIGNHDINQDASHDRYSDESFERAFGPSYYSFDHGPVHFICLDDIQWLVESPGKKGRYQGGLGPEQMEFIRNDLALVDDDQLVVLMMHIPLVDVEDRQELYRLIEKRKFCISISGHTHHHEHRFITRDDGWQGPEPHHHIINVTVSGSWWKGAPDERGIPHTMMADGAPNGYSIITFDGQDYSLEYKAAGRSADYQMQIHAPEVVDADKLNSTEVMANIFNGSERSKVEMRVGNSKSWQKMERVVTEDPGFRRIVELEKSLLAKNAPEKPWLELPNPKKSTHIWKGLLPEGISVGTHMIEIRETDMFGKTHLGRRVLRVQAAPATEKSDK